MHLSGLVRPILVFVALAAQPAFADTEPSRSSVLWGLDIKYVDASGHPSWTNGSAGKLLYDNENDGLASAYSFADITSRLTDTLDGHIVAELYDDDMGSVI